ncbi:MAG TPA: hypothetical protein V6D00_09725 [Pantanalinema sp.]
MPMLEFNRAEQQTLLEAIRRYMTSNQSPPVFLIGNQAITALNQRRRTPGPIRVQVPTTTVTLMRAALTDYSRHNEGDFEPLLAKLPS